MTLRLVSQDGETISPAWTGPRFRSVGGSLVDHANTHLRMTLADAEFGLRLFWRDIETDEANGAEPAMREARLLRRYADDLSDAIGDCVRQRAAAGWTDPYQADARTA